MRSPDVQQGEQAASVHAGGIALEAPDDLGDPTTVYVDAEFVQALADHLEGGE